MGRTTIDSYVVTPHGREDIRRLLESHHDDVWVCERTDLDDVGTGRKTFYLELSQAMFEECKAWRFSQIERETPHR